jgi:hypothetical protein|tara:strand:+ start:1059 stop:1541 length:483 start_codon:yes stop_codon:yes gene_type:complete
MIVYQPKGDFKSSISIQEQYVILLKGYHAQLMIQIKKSNAFQKAKLSVDLHDLSSKLDAQIKTLASKKNHYENYFLPDYNKQLEECENEFDTTWIEACRYLKLNEGRELSLKFKNAMDSFMELDKENREHIEVKNLVYKDLKTLLSLCVTTKLSNRVLDA